MPGMTHVLALPRDGVVVELVPTKRHIPNKLNNDALKSQCGYTMFGAMSLGRGLRYRAILMPEYGWEASPSFILTTFKF